MTQTKTAGPAARGPGFTSWIFILKEGMLPGQFFIQPFRPSPRELPEIIMEEAFVAFQWASSLYEMYQSAGLIRRSVNTYAGLCAQCLTRRFGCEVDIQVIPYEEFLNRAERGEFDIREATKKERQNDGWVFHKAIGSALDRYYTPKSKRPEDLLWRMQCAVGPRNKPFSTVCAWLDQAGKQFHWRWWEQGRTEVTRMVRRTLRLPAEYSTGRGT